METILAIAICGLVFYGIFWIYIKWVNRILARREKKYMHKQYILDFAERLNDEQRNEIIKYMNSDFNKKPTNIFITKNYLITKDLKLIELKNILWAYKFTRTVKTKRGNFLGEANKVCIILDNGKKLGFYQDFFGAVDDILIEIKKQAEWVIVGYSYNLEKDIKKNRTKYVIIKDSMISKLKGE